MTASRRSAAPAVGLGIVFCVTSPITTRAFVPPILKALVAAGAEVTVVSAGDEGLDAFIRGIGANLIAIDWARGFPGFKDIRAAVHLWWILRRLKPRLVVAATPKASLLAMLAAALTRRTRRVHLLWGLRSESLTGVGHFLVASAEWLTILLADNVIANSESLARAAQSRPMIPRNRVEVLGAGSSHGVDLNRFRPTTPIVRDPVVGFVGRLRRDKGLVELVEAIAMLRADFPRIKLLMVGNTEDTVAAEAIASHSEFIDHRQHTTSIEGLYREMRILCLPSWREGFPNVCLEAAASGLPVVVSDATGAVDAVVPGVTGFVVPRKNASEISSALRKLLRSDALCAEMGRAGRARVEALFDERLVCQALTEHLVEGALR